MSDIDEVINYLQGKIDLAGDYFWDSYRNNKWDLQKAKTKLEDDFLSKTLKDQFLTKNDSAKYQVQVEGVLRLSIERMIEGQFENEEDWFRTVIFDKFADIEHSTDKDFRRWLIHPTKGQFSKTEFPSDRKAEINLFTEEFQGLLQKHRSISRQEKQVSKANLTAWLAVGISIVNAAVSLFTHFS